MTTATINHPLVRATHPKVMLVCRKATIVALQMILIFAAYYLSFQMRFDFAPGRAMLQSMIMSVPLVIGVKLFAFHLFGLFRGWWRYVGISDLIDISKAALASSAV